MKRQYKLAKLLLLFLTFLILSGCNDSLIINNFNVDSELYNKQGYFVPKRVVKLSVDIDGNKREDLNYKWTANGGQFLEQNKAEVKYMTPNIPGEYNLFLRVTNNKGEHINHEFSFTVKGNYPQEVSLNSLNTTSVKSGVKVEWSKFPQSDFYTYKILRSNNHFIDSDAQVVATITDKDQTSFVDYNIKPKQVYSYQVMVINNEGYLSISNEKMIETLPQKIKKLNLHERMSDLVVSSTRSKLYITDSTKQKLLILDLNSYQVEKEINLNTKAQKIVLGSQEKYLFILASNNKTLLRLNLEDFSLGGFEFETEIKDISLTENYIYLATVGEYNLIKFDIKKGEILEKTKVIHNQNLVDASQINILKDQYLFIDKIFGESLIYKLKNLTNPIAKFDIGIVKNSVFCQVDEESCLYVANTHHPLQVYSGMKSGQIYLKNRFDEISTPTDFVIDQQQERIFAAVDKTIYIYSLQDNSLINKIELQSYINHLTWNEKQQKLYLLTSQINGENYNLMVANLN